MPRDPADKLIRLPRVLERVAVSRSTLLRWVAAGRFPAPVRIGARAVAWSERAVSDWIASRLAEQPAPDHGDRS